MSLRVTITLAGPPRSKGRPRAAVTKRGFAHVYTDDKTVKYEAQLRYAAQQEMAGRPPTIQPVRVHVEVTLQIMPSWPKRKQASASLGHIHPDTRGSGDVDNFLKILDSLNGVVWQDDCQIVEARVVKRYSETPYLLVVVETIEPPALPAPPREARRGVEDLFAPAERVG